MNPINSLWRSFLTSLALIVCGLSVQADVLVVHGSGSTGFVNIQAAVDAALEGDTILVRNGAYPSFTVDGKSVSIVADGAGVLVSEAFTTVSFGPDISVRNLAAGQQFVMRGVQADAGVEVLDCAGAVWFDQLSLSGNVSCSLGGTAGAYVRDSHQVTFTKSALRGETAQDIWFAHPSADGLFAERSTVWLFDCFVEGGHGQSTNVWAGIVPADGGPGVRVDQGSVTLIGSIVQGGGGGLDTFQLCAGAHATGGPGVEFVGGTGTVLAAESTAAGGVASLEPMCPGQSGPAGQPIIGGGTITVLVGFARHLSANSPVRGGETLTFDIEGQPGEIPIVFTSLAHQPVALGGGALLIGLPPTDMFVLAALPADGKASLSFPIQNVGASIGGVTYYGGRPQPCEF